jgi:DNA polymerase III delta subunit
MKISSLNFKNNLRENAVLSLIHGKEMILKNEVKDFLTKDFAGQGYDETIIFEANESDGLLSAIQNNLGGGLFGSQIIIKVVHSEGRFPKALSETLEKIDLDNMNNIKIVIDSISESISPNTKWIKDNKESIQIIECTKLKPLDEKKWLREKLNFLDINDADRVAKHLFELNSSNLVAHRNDIETLKILHSAKKDPVSLENSISSSIHTAYELEDCLLNLDEKKSIKILRQIKQNDPNSLALVIWVLDKLISTSLMAKKSASPKRYLENTKMWNSKISLYLSFIKRMESNLLNLSKDIFEIEKTFKGIKRLDAWKEVERLIIRICTS